MSVQLVGGMRQACVGCGGSCRGVVVRLAEEEVARIGALAAGLGVADAVVDGALRREDGACVLLDAAGRCRLHAAHGPESKPAICRQYPVVAVQTEGGVVRVGIDPGCYAHRATWRTAPPVPGGALQGSALAWSPERAEVEAAVLSWLDAPDARVGATLCRLLGAPGERPPPAFLDRLARLVRDAGLDALVDDASFGASWRAALAPVAEAARGWSAAPPWPAWSEEDEAWVLDAARRAVGLRLLHAVGPPQGGALLLLAGAVVVGWAVGGGDGLGRGLAAWSRALRSPRFVGTLLPDRGRLAWLVTGSVA